MPARVLIVDDSLVFRTKLEQSLSMEQNIQVVGTAMDPIDAMRKIEALKPNVITMDVEMPHMNGITFIKKLMPQYPIPVVVVSSLPINTLDALNAGAVDFVKKPTVQSPADMKAFLRELTAKIRIARNAKVRRMPAAVSQQLATNIKTPKVTPLRPMLSGKTYNPNTIIAIGASTGGTEAILEVVNGLPAETPGVIIVQHMPPVFTDMYAKRLDKICKMSVKEAADNDRVVPGRILIAAGEYHMRLQKDAKGYFIRSQKGPRVNGHCPSVDVLFESVAAVAGKNALGVILTGMGADGAKGITKMRQAGSYTIGQDQSTCVVYGMPMEAFKLGGISRQLPLDQIQDAILQRINLM